MTQFHVEAADPQVFGRVLRELKDLDNEASKAIRKRMREAAQPVIAEMRRQLTSGGYRYQTGLTQAIGRGIRVKISTSKTKPGISVLSSGSAVPAAKKALVRAFDKPSFRHPVYGNRDAWATQAGRPYFDTLLSRKKRDMEDAVLKALRDAAETVRDAQVTR